MLPFWGAGTLALQSKQHLCPRLLPEDSQWQKKPFSPAWLPKKARGGSAALLGAQPAAERVSKSLGRRTCGC